MQHMSYDIFRLIVAELGEPIYSAPLTLTCKRLYEFGERSPALKALRRGQYDCALVICAQYSYQNTFRCILDKCRSHIWAFIVACEYGRLYIATQLFSNVDPSRLWLVDQALVRNGHKDSLKSILSLNCGAVGTLIEKKVVKIETSLY